MEPLVAANVGAGYTLDIQMHRVLPGRILPVWIGTIVALLAAPAVAQQPQRTAPERPSGTGVIEGRVIDGETESPVAGATITLSFIPTGPMPRDGLTIHVVADGDGGFLFRDLPAGSHSLVAEALGYPPCCGVALEPDGPLQGVFLGDGERATDLVMRLWRRAVVTGLAADGSGAPAPGVRVTLFDAGRIAGRRRYNEHATSMTDDNGRFRFEFVPAGDYVACANYPNPPPGPDGVLMVYAHTCHDGDSLESAAPVTLGNGDVVETPNLAARLVRGVTLSGVVTGPDGPLGNATVHVRPARADPLLADSAIELARITSTSNGRFTLLGVPAGDYVLRVISSRAGQTWWGELPVTVGGEDVADLTLMTLRGARLSGRIEVERTGATSEPLLPWPYWIGTIAEGRTTLGAARGYYTRRDGRTPAEFRIEDDGTFRSREVPPGRYTVDLMALSIGDWRVSSVMSGGIDISQTPLDLAADDVDDVVITVTDRPAGLLTGLVLAPDGSPDRQAVIVVFPADSSSWPEEGPGPQHGRRAIPLSQLAGHYLVGGLSNGDFLVVALAGSYAGNWFDPELLARLAPLASRVRIVEGQERVLNLTTQEVR